MFNHSITKQTQRINLNEGNEGETVISSLSRICLTDELSDVTFKFPGAEKNSTIPAHKMMLAMRSPVFKAMFYGNFPQINDVEILDIKATTFMLMLKFLYTDQVELDEKNICSILYAAVKYQISALIITCELFLKDNLTESNACTIFTQAKKFSLQALEKQSLAFISDHAQQIFGNEDFCSLSKENLEEILKNNTLKIEEIEIFNAVLKWAETKLSDDKTEVTSSNKRKMILPNILYSMAIPCLKLDDFTNKVVPSGILTDAEQLLLFKAITMKGSMEPNNFRMKPRLSIRHAVVQLREIFPVYQRRVLSVYNIQNNIFKETFYVKPERNIRVVSVVMEVDVNVNNGGRASFSTLGGQTFFNQGNFNAAIQRIPALCTIKGKKHTGTFEENGVCRIAINDELSPSELIDFEFSVGQSIGFSFGRQAYSSSDPPVPNTTNWKDYLFPGDTFVAKFSRGEVSGYSFVKSIEFCF